jgi:pimeloyl-ACP methyl ester carboxylesterase
MAETTTAAALLLRPATFIANGEDVAAIDRFLAVQSESYGRLTMPTAIVAGDADAIVASDANAQELAKRLPSATLTLSHGVGHMVHYVAQDQVIEAIGKMTDYISAR